MLAALKTQKTEDNQATDDTPMIVLLDFRKAYDTVDRSFLQQALLKFGFSARFTELIHRLHQATTARFIVNNEQSQAFHVRTGIRQGCPLAPLLFLLAIEVLGHGFRNHQQLKGIQVTSLSSAHLFSGFVDDSALFLKQTAMVPTALAFLEEYGQMSGLQVQPTKSIGIPLNRAAPPPPNSTEFQSYKPMRRHAT